MTSFKIAYVSFGKPDDTKYWSGIPFWTIRHLCRRGHSVTHVHLPHRLLKSLFLPQKLLARVRNKEFLVDRENLFLQALAIEARFLLNDLAADIIMTPSSVICSIIRKSIPAIFWTDAVIEAFAKEYVEDIGRPPILNLEAAHRQEQAALQRCSYALYFSQWAIESVKRHYEVDEQKLVLAPFPPNLENPLEFSQVSNVVLSRRRDRLQLLFIGIDWHRKGGPFALEVARQLNELSVPTEIHIVGCRPFGNEAGPPYAIVHGFIDKRSPAGLEQLNKLLLDSHFLILPSQAEAQGIVFLEANAYAVPGIGTAIGGIPSVVKDGVNGVLIKQSMTQSEVAHLLRDIFLDRHRYSELAAGCFKEFHQQFSWDRRLDQLESLFEAACARC